jgi:hypothetical protein
MSWWADENHLIVFTIDFPYQISSGGVKCGKHTKISLPQWMYGV